MLPEAAPSVRVEGHQGSPERLAAPRGWRASRWGEGEGVVSQQGRRSNSGAERVVVRVADWLAVAKPARAEVLTTVERLLAAA
jgi:hypothetical protein